MKVNGYKIQQALREAEQIRVVLTRRFQDSRHYFPGPGVEPPNLSVLMKDVIDVEARICMLQSVQTLYNTRVVVKVASAPGVNSLLIAVKAVGGLGRVEKLWRETAAPKQDRYDSYRDNTRKQDDIVRQDSMKPERALEHAKAASRRASDIREAIAVANATEVDMDVDPGIFG